MKILMIGHSADRTGAPISLLQMASAMKKLGHEVRFGLRRPGPLLDEYTALASTFVLKNEDATLSLTDLIGISVRHDPVLALKCFRTPDRPYCLSSDAVRHAKQWSEDVKTWKPDWIYVNTSHCGDMLQFVADLNVPVITHVRELGPTISALDPRRKTFFLRQTDHFLAASQAVKTDLSEFGADNEKITVEEPAMVFDDANLVDDKDVDADLGLQNNDILILGVGTPCHRKGTDLFVSAALSASHVYAGEKRLVFLWMGGGGREEDLAEYRAMIRGAEMENVIRFAGEITNPYPLYRRATLVLMTSREDPNPRVVMEATSVGTKVLSFDENGGAPAFIRELGAGELVSDFDPVQMGQKAVSMISQISGKDRELAEKVKNKRDVMSSASRILEIAARQIERH